MIYMIALAELISDDPVYRLRSPGSKLDSVDTWDQQIEVMGGDATTNGASCQTRRKPAKDTQDPAIGFRCCVSLVDPNAPAPKGAGPSGKGRKRKRGK